MEIKKRRGPIQTFFLSPFPFLPPRVTSDSAKMQGLKTAACGDRKKWERKKSQLSGSKTENTPF